jgi:tetratricopeptide (TPR) repeat protein
MAAEPALPEFTDSKLADAKELASIVSAASSHWLDARKAGSWPDVLPEPLADKVASFSNPELSEIRAANDFLQTWKTDAAAAMAAWTGDHQTPQTSPAISEWVKNFRESCRQNLATAETLRDQAAERLATGKSSLAVSKIHEASVIAPSKEDASAKAVLDAYESLLKYAGGVDGDALPIPPSETLDACVEASALARTPGLGNLGKAIDPYAKALRIAPLLKEFSKISDPGPNLPQSPVKAYSELHGTSEWLSVAEDTDQRTKALAPILENITASLGKKHGEYRTLVEEADGLAAAGKFSEAAKTYRKAFAIEGASEIAAKIKTCESKISGL